jgi:hypothetical protein
MSSRKRPYQSDHSPQSNLLSSRPSQSSDYKETSGNTNLGEPLLQPCSEPTCTPLLANVLESGITNLGGWWTSTLEETLGWPSLHRPGFQIPSVITLTDRPLSEVRLPSNYEASQNSSLPPSPDQEAYLSLDDVDEISRFVEKFLKEIHVLNPLIEPTFFRNQIAVTAETGFQWDSAACLLVSGRS